MGLTRRERERITMETVEFYECDECGMVDDDGEDAAPLRIPAGWFLWARYAEDAKVFCCSDCVAAYVKGMEQ